MKYYQHISFFTFIITCFSACNNEKPEQFALIGEWNWIKTIGGWGSEFDPESVGYQVELKFTSSNQYSKYVADTLSIQGTYFISKDSMDGTMNFAVFSSDGNLSKRKSFFIQRDTLLLYDALVPDLPSSYYKRK